MAEKRIELRADDETLENLALICEQYDLSAASGIRIALAREAAQIRRVRARDGQPTHPRGWENGNPNKLEKGGTE